MKNIFWGLIEDDVALRNSLQDYLFLNGCFISFSTDTVGEVLSGDHEDDPQFILLDEHVTDASGIDSIAKLKKKFTDANIILFTGDKSPDLVLKALENGACGFLYKPFSFSQLESIITDIEENGAYLHPLSASKLISTLKSAKDKKGRNYSKLSKKEAEIVNLLQTGKSYKEIATALNKSFYTVNYHMKNIYSNYNVNSKAELLYILNKI
jgi:DNA-binding NarL/FixJ family response regulator